MPTCKDQAILLEEKKLQRKHTLTRLLPTPKPLGVNAQGLFIGLLSVFVNITLVRLGFDWVILRRLLLWYWQGPFACGL